MTNRTANNPNHDPKHGPQDWDDTDIAIWHLRIHQRKTWRQIADQLGHNNHQSAMRRFQQRMTEIEPSDIHQMRTEENQKLDHLENKWANYITKAQKRGDHNAEAKGLEGLRRAMVTRHTINGLAKPQPTTDPISPDQLHDKLDAYMQGAADATAALETDPEEETT